MDYKGHVCPVCNKTFEDGEDIVVCPVCGTPHHRECYEEKGECANAHLHKEKYDYTKDSKENENTACAEEVTCPFCKSKNPQGSKFCNSCGRPMMNNVSANQSPFGGFSSSDEKYDEDSNPMGGMFIIDPMGGVKPDEKVADGVTAGEAAKFVKTSTPHFVTQFKQIYSGRRARFSFVGFIFGGGWMLYRKMYGLGTFFTALWGLIILSQMYIEVIYKNTLLSAVELYTEIFAKQGFGLNFFDAFQSFLDKLTTEQSVVFFLYLFLAFLTLLTRIICGIMGNRWYYKHSVKKIKNIKRINENPQEQNKEILRVGGVNVGIAISLIVSYMILTYLPLFF